MAVAAPNEAQAILRGLGVPAPANLAPWTLSPLAPRIDLLLAGIGKTNAAAALSRFADPTRHAAVLSVGIGGALPIDNPAALGQAFVASSSVYADEGLQTPEKFVTCEEMGFPLGPFSGNAISADPRWYAALTERGLRSAVVATVSTCSGTDALAHQVAARTKAHVEAMEGAAIGHVAVRLGLRFGEVRVVSNTTGDRQSQRWEIRAAFDRLASVIGSL